MDTEFESIILEIEFVEDSCILVFLLESNHQIASKIFELFETTHETGLPIAEIALQFGHLPR
jgi:hypothetical protein